jgi:predicted DNA-binding protein with PD1-like motif
MELFRETAFPSKLVHELSGQRTFVVALKTGEEVMDCLSKFAEKERVSAAQISAIGALSDVETRGAKRATACSSAATPAASGRDVRAG